MHWIWDRQRFLVTENRGSFEKGDPVLSSVGLRFFAIPLEIQTHGLSRCGLVTVREMLTPAAQSIQVVARAADRSSFRNRVC